MKTSPNNTTIYVAGRSWPSASLLLTGVAILAYFVPGISDSWNYEPEVGLSEAWRFLTCHWVHWSGEHLLWSGGAFLILSAAAEDTSRRLYCACVFISALLIPMGMKLWSPEIASYGGLSGIDSALFGLVAVSRVRDSITARKWTGAFVIVLLSAGFVAKIGFELISGGAFFVNSTAAMVPVPIAHILGAITGVFVGLGGQIQTPWLLGNRELACSPSNGRTR